LSRLRLFSKIEYLLSQSKAADI